MTRKKVAIINLVEKIQLLKAAGIQIPPPKNTVLLNDESEEISLQPLPERIQHILGIIKSKPQKATTMNFLILYDIEDDKVRKIIAKYLQQKGCVRIQKSVFMANSSHQQFLEIHSALKDINDFYENTDSIIVAPINVADVRSMKLIGKNVNIDILTNPPNTLFF